MPKEYLVHTHIHTHTPPWSTEGGPWCPAQRPQDEVPEARKVFRSPLGACFLRLSSWCWQLPDRLFRVHWKALSKIWRSCPTFVLGFLCNLEMCNMASDGCQKKNSEVAWNLSLCAFPQVTVRLSQGENGLREVFPPGSAPHHSCPGGIWQWENKCKDCFCLWSCWPCRSNSVPWLQRRKSFAFLRLVMPYYP